MSDLLKSIGMTDDEIAPLIETVGGIEVARASRVEFEHATGDSAWGDLRIDDTEVGWHDRGTAESVAAYFGVDLVLRVRATYEVKHARREQ